MDVQDVITRGRRDIEWDRETAEAVAALVEQVPLDRRRSTWSARRRLLVLVPAAAVVAAALTGGGLSIVNSLTSIPDAVVAIHYTAADGSAVSCEVTVEASAGPAKRFIHDHDWSVISHELQASVDQGVPRSPMDLIDDEIPASMLQGDVLLNFATSCR